MSSNEQCLKKCKSDNRCLKSYDLYILTTRNVIIILVATRIFWTYRVLRLIIYSIELCIRLILKTIKGLRAVRRNYCPQSPTTSGNPILNYKSMFTFKYFYCSPRRRVQIAKCCQGLPSIPLY